ncbi:MAG: hypothetical protein IKJ68_09785 [Clostridia bacterium]|nr:hypothetical protein [Clostridia bacterium]
MWLRFTEIKLLAAKLVADNTTEEKEKEIDLLKDKVCKILGFYTDKEHKSLKKIVIYRKSPDLRTKTEPHFVYTIDAEVEYKVKINKTDIVVITKKENLYDYYISQISNKIKKTKTRPVVVGFGPAGMFAALVLAEAGYKPIVLERGQKVEERIKSVKDFHEKGHLNTESNIQFGEGGAGTFSDGKLNSLIKDKDTIGRFVLETFVKFGAPEEILYKNKPHIGTDILRNVVKNIREYIVSKGGEIRFDTKMTEILTCGGEISGVKTVAANNHLSVEKEIATECVILAIGHSARDTFAQLKRQQIAMEKKPFSVGVRIEHLQEEIDRSQYGGYAEIMRRLNGAADYKLSHRASNGRGVYTFCMCPGGYVVGAASEEGRLVTNGMSNFDRAGRNANAAVLVGVTPEDFPGEDVLAGVEFQRKIEAAAYTLGGSTWRAPCQLAGDFIIGRESKSVGKVESTFSNGYKFADLNEILPQYVSQALKEGITAFGKKIKGFDDYDAVLTGCETRSSSPVRILRDDKGSSVSVKGLFPAGEGAGYAGGILSAAADGIKVVEKWLDSL